MSEAAADLLERTADVIEERGHAKERLEDEQGRVCLLGGIHLALWGEIAMDAPIDRFLIQAELDVRTEALEALRRYVGLRSVAGLVPWNNRPSREPHEVIDACRHAAKVLRGG